MIIIKKVKTYILNKLRRAKLKLHFHLRTVYTFRNRSQQVGILIGSPEHGNLGDHAISLAEISFLKERCQNLKVVEISGPHFREDAKGIIKSVKPNDIVFITGGGFLGSLWILEEEMVRKIIREFPDNRIVILPQTIYFENTDLGQCEKRISQITYEGHSNLCLCLRDKQSYEFIKKEFINLSDYLLLPDMVTYLNMKEPVLPRDGALICIRTDKERLLCQESLQEIEQIFYGYNLKFSYISTVLNYGVQLSEREKEFTKIIDEFKHSEIVITDRLHGMLFAAISGTPCIALDNLSGKVKGVYEWISHLSYIKFISELSEIEDSLDKLLKQDPYFYDNEKLEPYFEQLAKKIKGSKK